MRFIKSFLVSFIVFQSFSLYITFATSPTIIPETPVVIYQVQLGGPGTGTASQEIVLLYNESLNDINITNWCLQKSTYSSVDDGDFSNLSCVDPPDINTEIWLPSTGYVSFATSAFVDANTGFTPDFSFSSHLSTSGGHIRIIDGDSEEVDRVDWGPPTELVNTYAPVPADGEVLSRDLTAETIDTDNSLEDFSSDILLNPIPQDIYEQAVPVDQCTNIEGFQAELPVGYLKDTSGDCILDECPNIDGLQAIIPESFYFSIDDNKCLEIPPENAEILITELLPNAPSYDSGNEFIELFNPNNRPINLKGYKLQLGPSFTKEYIFTDGVILAGEYRTFSDAVTGIVLPNTAASSVRLIAPADNLVSQTGVYSHAGDTVSWSIVSDVWIFTNQITPGAPNKPYLQPAENEVLGVTTVLAPCGAGKFRNPDTNRCKYIVTAVSALTPCSAGQFRNPATNRCKKISTTTSALKPCKVGQERNPETNRCKNVAVLGSSSSSSSALPTINDVKAKNTKGSINWSVISIAVGSTFGYMIYEWRAELRNRLLILRS